MEDLFNGLVCGRIVIALGGKRYLESLGLKWIRTKGTTVRLRIDRPMYALFLQVDAINMIETQPEGELILNAKWRKVKLVGQDESLSNIRETLLKQTLDFVLEGGSLGK